MEQLYGNQLKSLLTDPSSYQGSPGFKFALNSGLDGISRKYAAMGMGSSGNVLGELTKYGVGLASQDYGNQVDRLGRLQGQEQQNALGETNAANTRLANDQQFGLGTMRANNDYSIAQGQNANTAQRNWYDYSLGADRNNLTAADQQNQYQLGQGRNAIDWYNAGTGRGAAQSNAYLGGQRDQRDWYSVFPRQRIAGQP